MELDAGSLLEQLATEQSAAAWAEFLDQYSPLIYRVAHDFDRDEDRVADAYLYVCDRLRQDDFRRLRAFRIEEGVQFSTWLRIIVRNLCTDWLRQRLGRPRVFESVAKRSALEEEVFRSLFHEGLTLSETTAKLRLVYPELTVERISEITEDLHQSLSVRQHWLLSTRRPVVKSLSEPMTPGGLTVESRVADSNPGPEALAQVDETRTILVRALRELTPSERLILRWRFEQGLTLDHIARLKGLSGPQAASRRIEKVLRRLRERMHEKETKSSA